MWCPVLAGWTRSGAAKPGFPAAWSQCRGDQTAELCSRWVPPWSCPCRRAVRACAPSWSWHCTPAGRNPLRRRKCIPGNGRRSAATADPSQPGCSQSWRADRWSQSRASWTSRSTDASRPAGCCFSNRCCHGRCLARHRSRHLRSCTAAHPPAHWAGSNPSSWTGRAWWGPPGAMTPTPPRCHCHSAWGSGECGTHSAHSRPGSQQNAIRPGSRAPQCAPPAMKMQLESPLQMGVQFKHRFKFHYALLIKKLHALCVWLQIDSNIKLRNWAQISLKLS